MILRLAQYFRSGSAVSALEYAAIVGILVVGLGAAVVAFRGKINAYLTKQGNQISTLT